MRKILILLMGLLFLIVNYVYADFPYHLYQQTEINELIELGESDKPQDGTTRGGLYIPPQRYRAIVKYINVSHGLGEIYKNFLNGLTTYSQYFYKQEHMELFKGEITVEEDGIRYKLPIQEVLIGYVEDELKTGDIIEVYFYWVGAIYDTYVFIVNEFHLIEEVDFSTPSKTN